jgi:hypothetical protein
MRDGVRVHPSQLTASIPTADALIDEPGQDAPAIIDGTRRRAVPAERDQTSLPLWPAPTRRSPS